MALRTDYTDAVWSGNKKYKMINNTDGTVSFEDVTEYTSKENSFFGANDANTMNSVLNTYKSQTDTNTSDISTNTSDIATIKTQLTDGATVNAGLWGGLTQDTATNNTTSTQILVRNGSKVQSMTPSNIMKSADTYVALGSSWVTSLVTANHSSFVVKMANGLKFLYLNLEISGNGLIVNPFSGGYEPKRNATVNALFPYTLTNSTAYTTGYLSFSTSGITLVESDLGASKRLLRQTIIYY